MSHRWFKYQYGLVACQDCGRRAGGKDASCPGKIGYRTEEGGCGCTSSDRSHCKELDCRHTNEGEQQS